MEESIVLVELGTFGSNIYIKHPHLENPIKNSYFNSLDILDPNKTINIRVFRKLAHQIISYLEINNIDLSDAFFIATGIYRDATNKDTIYKTLETLGIETVKIIPQLQEFKHSFNSFFKYLQDREAYTNIKYFDIGGGSIEIGEYKDDYLNYLNGTSFGTLYGLKILFFAHRNNQMINLADAFMRLQTLINYEITKLEPTFNDSDFNYKCVIGGSSAKNIKKHYYNNDYLSLDDLKAYIKLEKNKLFDSYRNVKHLERFYVANKSIGKQLRTLIGALIIEQLLNTFEISHFEVNKHSLLDGVVIELEN